MYANGHYVHLRMYHFRRIGGKTVGHTVIKIMPVCGVPGLNTKLV